MNAKSFHTVLHVIPDSLIFVPYMFRQILREILKMNQFYSEYIGEYIRRVSATVLIRNFDTFYVNTTD